MAMMDPTRANKPPPDFIRRTIDPTFAAKEAQESTLEMTDNAELEKPIMKRKKRRPKANKVDELLEDDQKIDLPAPEVKKPEPSKPKEPEVVKEPPKPKEPEVVKEPAKPIVPKKPVEVKKEPEPPAQPKKKPMGFLDDSDSDDDDDDFFAKKKPQAKPAESKPATTAPPAKKPMAMFLDSDDDDNDSDGSFD